MQCNMTFKKINLFIYTIKFISTYQRLWFFKNLLPSLLVFTLFTAYSAYFWSKVITPIIFSYLLKSIYPIVNCPFVASFNVCPSKVIKAENFVITTFLYTLYFYYPSKKGFIPFLRVDKFFNEPNLSFACDKN